MKRKIKFGFMFALWLGILVVLYFAFSSPAGGSEIAETDEPIMSAVEPLVQTEQAPAPKAEEISEPCHWRDDIVSDGTLLSYELQEVMQDCGEKYNVPYALLLAIAETESRFDPDAVSSTHDYGLMQINECNHEWLLEQGIDPKTPSGNIESGAYIISQHLQRYEEPELALMAYNCGPSGARKLWDSGIYQTDYSQKVMSAFERWENVLENEYEEEQS